MREFKISIKSRLGAVRSPFLVLSYASLVSNCIYFGKKNQFWVYTNAAIEQQEKIIKTFSENEEIAFIQREKECLLNKLLLPLLFYNIKLYFCSSMGRNV